MYCGRLEDDSDVLLGDLVGALVAPSSMSDVVVFCAAEVVVEVVLVDVGASVVVVVPVPLVSPTFASVALTASSATAANVAGSAKIAKAKRILITGGGLSGSERLEGTL